MEMTKAAPPTDEELLLAFGRGDEAAFEALLMRHRRPLYATALAILRHPEDAEDATQLALLKVYERARQYRGDAPARIWLRRLTVSTCLDALRRRRVRAFLCPWREDAPEPSAPEHDGTEATLFYQGLRDRVDAILRRLPARQRVIFGLRVYQEWSLRDIAESLELDLGTVKTHLFRAIHRVRDELRVSELEFSAARPEAALAEMP